MRKKCTIMIFAAGFGKRMGKFVYDKPKPLVEVCGVPLLEYAFSLCRDVEPALIVMNAHYKHEVLCSYLRYHPVTVITELPDILETGGGLKAAIPILGSKPVVTLNSDVIWLGDNPLSLLLEAWNAETMDALLMCVPIEQTFGRVYSGDFTLNGDGTLQRGGKFVYSGAQIIKTDLVAVINDKAFSLNKVWDIILSRNRLFGLSYNGNWCDVGTSGGVYEAEKKIREAAEKNRINVFQ